MDDETARALISALGEPNERRIHELLTQYQPAEIVKLPFFTARMRGIEKNIHRMLECARTHYTWITPHSDSWPMQISRLMYEQPVGLWLSGNTKMLQRVQISIVGSRNCSTYGTTVAMRFAQEISATSITVVSGGARGVDEAAHHGALRASGKTIAVMAGGFTHLYPRTSTRLFQRIEDNGLLVSEVAPWRTAKPHWFLNRNRLITALSESLVVVEAQVRSGAMSSVSYANKVGIEVCVVPGSINSPLSDGCHALIRDGATLVTSTQDIINIVLPTIKMQQTQAQFAYEPSV